MAESNDNAASPTAATARAKKAAAPKAAKPKPAASKSASAKPSGGNGASGTKASATRGTASASWTGTSGAAPRAQARNRFNAAIDEARAGVAALRADALERGTAYRRATADNAATWVEDARAMGEQARKRAADAAREGKSRTSDGLAALGKTVSDTAGVIDERLGAQYGDYARNAARSLQEAAAKLDAKDIEEIGEDAREFVRKSPGAAIGIAAVAGFFLARMFRGSND